MVLYNKYENHEDSPKLRKNKLRYRINAKLVRFTWLQRAIIAGCMAIFIYSTVITGKALYTFGLVQIEHEKYSDISISSDPDRESLEFIETLYLPEYIPDGYQLSEQIGKPFESNLIEVIYRSSNEIIFQQATFDLFEDLDNENVNSSRIHINNCQGIYQEKKGTKTLVWTDEKYFYFLWCNSPNTKKLEIIKMAESLTEVSHGKN